MFRKLAGALVLVMLLTGIAPALAQRDNDLTLLGDKLADTRGLEMFAEAMETFGFNDILNDPDVFYTIFALDDNTMTQALDSLGGYESIRDVSKNEDDAAILTLLLRYHILPGFLTADALVAIDAQIDGPAKLAGGLPGTYITLEDGVLNGGVNVTDADVLADNGAIHVVDNVLFPEGDTFSQSLEILQAHLKVIEGYEKADSIAEQLQSADGFTMITQAFETVGFMDDLDEKGPYTVFVMSDESLTRVLDAAGVDFDDLLDNQEFLTRILLYHIVPGMGSSEVYKNLDGILVGTMLQGTVIGVASKRNILSVNDVRITGTDVLASNGIIHIIDGLMVPPQAEE